MVPDLWLEEDVQLAAACNAPVLISGENAAEAERLALDIHRRGARAMRPVVAIDAAVRELQSLLGDAIRRALSPEDDGEHLLARASGGTLFIAHVADLSAAMQMALLQLLEHPGLHEAEGIRLIAATGDIIFDRMQKGQFSEDLFFRLNVIRIQLPEG